MQKETGGLGYNPIFLEVKITRHLLLKNFVKNESLNQRPY